MKRDIQGKFALKNEDYRLVRSLRLTDETWKALGIAAERLGITRADYLEQIVRDNALPGITWKEEAAVSTNTRQEGELPPCITRKEEHHPQENASVMEQVVITVQPQMVDLEALRDSEALRRSADRILLDLKLGKQAPGYKAAQKALNRFIAELASPA
jgi:hypothetical protein